MKTLCSQIRRARQQRHMTQSALARQVGCKQSALSMFETGRTTALNGATIGKICQVLGLLPPSGDELEAAPRQEEAAYAFCPNPECPGNLPAAIGDSVTLFPRRHALQAGEVHCALCGEVLERTCPECGAPVRPGAFCVRCGTAYLAVAPERVDPARVALSERLEAWMG